MSRKYYLIANTILFLIGAIILVELVRDAQRAGDFVGYVNAGNAVLHGVNIYADKLNTWPPFFSVFSVPLAITDGFDPFLIRFLWLLGSIISMYIIVAESCKLIFKKSLGFKPNTHNMLIQEPIIIIPLLIMLRYIMDNLANVQINIFILLSVVLCLKFFIQKKYLWAGLLLGLSISLKVYTVFFLLYFLYKRAFKPVLWTLFFLMFFNALPFLVFGYEQAVQYYQYWAGEVISNAYIANHKNQSVFGAFLRFFTTEDPDHKLFVNILNVNPHTAKMMSYAAIAVVSLLPAFLFRKKLQITDDLRAMLEYSIVFTAIPLLSPVSWKAYFIFLWIPYLLTYALLFRSKVQLSHARLKLMKALFWLSVVLNVGSTELIVGRNFSNIMEAYSAITFGTIILLFMQLYIIYRLKEFYLGTIQFKCLEGIKRQS